MPRLHRQHYLGAKIIKDAENAILYNLKIALKNKIWDFLRFNVRNRGEINFKIIEQIILLLIIVRTLNINSFLALKT